MLADDSLTVTPGSSNNTLTALTNDSDSDGQPLTLISMSAPQHGVADLAGNKIVYTPQASYTGAAGDPLTFTITAHWAALRLNCSTSRRSATPGGTALACVMATAATSDGNVMATWRQWQLACAAGRSTTLL